MAHFYLQAQSRAEPAPPTGGWAPHHLRVELFAQSAMAGQIAEQASRDLVSVNGRLAIIESRMQSMQAATERAARDLCLAYDRMVSVEARMEAVEAHEDRHTAWAQQSLAWCQSQFRAMTSFVESRVESRTQSMQAATEHTARDLSLANDRQISVETRMDAVEAQADKLTESFEKLAKELIAANDRIESIETLLNDRIDIDRQQQHLFIDRMGLAENIIARHEHDLFSASRWSRNLETRVESIDKLVKEHIATTSLGMESIEKLTKEISAELHALQIAGGQVLRALVSANDRQASLERRMESIENLNDQQIAAQLQELQTARAPSDLILANDQHASRDVDDWAHVDWEQL